MIVCLLAYAIGILGGFFLGIVFRDWQMSDDCDRAEERIESTIEDSLAKVRRRMGARELDPAHACHWCGEFIVDNRLFCCKECSDDWTQSKRFHTGR